MELLNWLAVVSFGATIFALIVGVFSAYNGRRTRADIGNLIRETSSRTQELIHTSQAGTRQLLEQMDKRLEAQHALMRQMDERLQAQHSLMERMDQRLEAQRSLLERQHMLLERIADRQDNLLTAVRQSRS